MNRILNTAVDVKAYCRKNAHKNSKLLISAKSQGGYQNYGTNSVAIGCLLDL